MVLGYLQVMLLGNRHGVPQPGTNDVNWVTLGELRLPARPKIVKKLRPRFQAGLADDAEHLRSQIGVRIAGPANDMDSARWGQVERLFEVRTKFREYGHPALGLAFMVLRLGAGDSKAIPFPIHVRPLKCQVLRRAAKSAVSAQSEEQPPLGIRASVKHL